MTGQVPAWAAKFNEKSADYNSGQEPGELVFEPHRVLGVKGQFADVWRKLWKLKKALWDGEKLTGEQPREIIQDLISHLFLTLDLLDEAEAAQFPGVTLETEGERPTAPNIKKMRYLRDFTGHGYDGCSVCVRYREANPELIV